MPTTRAKPWKSPSLKPASDGNETVAILRRSSEIPTDSVQVRYRDAELWLEVQQAGRPLLSGNWRAGLKLGDDPELTPVGSWTQLCWSSDRDVDYLELELALAGGWKLQRQIVLAREDAFLFLADAVIAPGDINGHRPLIRLTEELTLGSAVRSLPGGESREAFLAIRDKKIASLLPLALPEWRVERGPGDFAVEGQSVRYQVLGEGRAAFAPLWLDLDAQRTRKPLTWRRLTVAEDRRVVPRETAVGYRVQAGNWQWLFYRSLARKGNRTLVGYNTAYEFGALRFLPNGTSKPLIEIE